jgi:hypothetical protein
MCFSNRRYFDEPLKTITTWGFKQEHRLYGVIVYQLFFQLIQVAIWDVIKVNAEIATMSYKLVIASLIEYA